MLKAPETLEGIENIDREMLCPHDVAMYLCASVDIIDEAAKLGMLPWAYRLGKSTFIPKEAFVFQHRYGRPVIIGGSFQKDDKAKDSQSTSADAQ